MTIDAGALRNLAADDHPGFSLSKSIVVTLRLAPPS
jgi:hypothetical protein